MSSFRQILRATSIVGGASVINVLIGLIRTKIAALYLGPSGVGLIGLCQSLMAVAALVAGMGTSTVGTRQLAAAAQKDEEALHVARAALMIATVILALLGGTLFWIISTNTSTRIFGDSRIVSAVGWLGVGVTFAVLGSGQTALLNGLRRLSDLARYNVISALIATVVGGAAIAFYNEDAIVFFVISIPLSAFVVGCVILSKLERLNYQAVSISKLIDQWSAMFRLGGAFMVSGVVAAAGQLFIRTTVHDSLGADALGHFQAAWSISSTYISFVLAAMGADFFPRLTSVISDRSEAVRLVNEQTEVALILAAPFFLLMMGFSPLVIKILYSGAFDQAAALLRIQVLGDVLKIMSWPLGFVMLAKGDGRTYMVTETVGTLFFSVFVFVALPTLGLESTCLGYLFLYIVYLPIVYRVARNRIGFKWSRRCVWFGGCVFLSSVFIASIAMVSQLYAAVLCVASSIVFILYGVNRVLGLNSKLGHLGVVQKVKRILEKMGVRRD